MKTKIISRQSLLYQIVIERLSEMIDVKEVIEIYVNSTEKMYTATWIDLNGITHTNSGHLPDINTTIKFI